MTDNTSTFPRISGFDGLRALAVLMVILWHTVCQLGPSRATYGPFETLFMSGWAGVDLFFVLSGFLIT
jgi:peptidoglycan/LPS O-acetylase OafA/YrhL